MRISKNEKYLSLIMIAFYLPFLLSDLPFRDDLSRTYWGFVGLSQLGRPLADIVYSLVGFGYEGVNLSPMPKIIALLIILSSAIFSYRTLFNSIGATGLLSLSIFFANPFIIQNFAYQYDCFPMALSILLATLSVLYRPRSSYFYFLSASFLLTSAISLYQASIFIAASLYLCKITIYFVNDRNRRDVFIECMLTLLSSFFSIACYMVILLFVENGVSKRASITGPSGVISNIEFLLDRLNSLYHSVYIFFIILSLVLIFSLLRIFILKRYINLCVILLILVALLGSSLLPSVILKEGFAGPRVLMSICSVFIFISIIATGKEKYVYAMVLSVLMMHSMSISYAFSGDIKAQYDRYSMISSLVYKDIDNYVSSNTAKIYISCKSTPSQREYVFYKFNNHIAWLNPEEAWAIRFFIRNNGESRVVHSWDECFDINGGKIVKENALYKMVENKNSYYFIMK
ncbi:TPA: glucosyltransferase domain-containing protein [Escherichia coli]|nr:glucosyltransferase domain-containing protein [Escherichia coli]HDJ8648292.1 glucosyltransferase domain-containing protein [Escherichia coli]